MNDNQESAEEWMAISDLMSGLMLIFLLIAISFMYQVQKDKEKVVLEKQYLEEIIKENEAYKDKDKEKIILEKKDLEKIIEENKVYQNKIVIEKQHLEKVLKENKLYKSKLEQISKKFASVESSLNEAFLEEFSQEELEKWNVEILKDNTIRFKSPDILFKKGKSDLSMVFNYVLEDFFPRYIKVLTNKKFINHIEEIRIEGHTSSHWNSSKRDSYKKNLKLSQERARNVLNFVINRSEVISKFNWLTSVFRANGLSSSQLIYDDKGQEDIDASRRVEFRVMTKSREALRKLEQLRLDMRDR